MYWRLLEATLLRQILRYIGWNIGLLRQIGEVRLYNPGSACAGSPQMNRGFQTRKSRELRGLSADSSSFTARATLVRANFFCFPINEFRRETHFHFVRVRFLLADDRVGAEVHRRSRHDPQ